MESIINFFSKKRVFTAIVFIAITLAACILGGPLWFLFVIVLTTVGVDELVKLFNAKEIYPSKYLIYLCNYILIVLAIVKKPEYFIHVIVIGFILTFVSFLFIRNKPSVNDITATVFSILYTGLLPVHFILVRDLNIDDVETLNSFVDPGASFLLLILFTIFASDIGAYYIGTRFGKTKLCPNISPKKTVEGAIGGTLFGVVIAVIASFILDLDLIHSIILGIIVVAAAQLGDLCESLIKRDVGVKDSGDIVPGHGGLLDRADSYIITAAATYYYIKWVILTGIF